MTPANLAIVLTGTIVPNTSFVVHADPRARRAEYLNALRIYSQFAPTFFLENSSYPLLTDPEFLELKGVKIRKFPLSVNTEKGKGYQEFHVLDQWVKTETELPKRFLKISGRYIFRNFDRIWDDCRREIDETAIIIDQYASSQVALSQLFCISVDNYRGALAGLYEGCDDMTGKWIERVIYAKFQSGKFKSRYFIAEPWLTVISGSTGISVGDSPVKHVAKQLLRTINRTINKERLYLR